METRLSCVEPKSGLNHKPYSYRKRTWKLGALSGPRRLLGLQSSSLTSLWVGLILLPLPGGFLHSPGHRVKYGCLRGCQSPREMRWSCRASWGFPVLRVWLACSGWLDWAMLSAVAERICHHQAPPWVGLVHAGSQREGGFSQLGRQFPGSQAWHSGHLIWLLCIMCYYRSWKVPCSPSLLR